VLVVDDDPEMRLAIMAILGPSFDALGAEHGQQALELLEHRDVSLLITDVRMPVMDGRELVRRVRRDPRLRDLPVLVQTSDVEAARHPEWTSLGVERVMTKDQFIDWLLMRIDQRLTEASVGVGAPLGP
jgi:CheY-like chemotaxis protein